jgi:hypothetical protein
MMRREPGQDPNRESNNNKKYVARLCVCACRPFFFFFGMLKGIFVARRKIIDEARALDTKKKKGEWVSQSLFSTHIEPSFFFFF